jgi:hypothetical protein
MNILVDCDGVLCDLVGHLYSKLELGDPSQQTQWDLPKQAKEYMSDGIDWGEVEPYPEAGSFLDALSLVGKIVIVTSPWFTNKDFFHSLYRWLWRHFGIRPDDIIFTSKKHLVTGAVLIDDKPSTLKRWTEEQCAVGAICKAQPWNSDYDGIRLDYSDIIKALEKIDDAITEMNQTSDTFARFELTEDLAHELGQMTAEQRIHDGRRP